MNNIKTNLQKGFTLIELMIVIAIIGILLAIAIPAYGDYAIRARTTECMNNLAPLKTGVSEFVIGNAHYPAFIDSIGTATATRMCKAPTYANTGVLKIQNSDSTGVAAGSTEIVLTPSTPGNGVQWKCTATAGTGAKYAPASCR